MPKYRKPTSGSTELRACTECRKRKSKCSGVSPCQYCSRSKKPCVFESPPTRTPLTRKNLDEAEHRCTKLLALIRRLNPEIEIEDELRTATCSIEDVVEPPPERLQSEDSAGESIASSDRLEWDEASLASSRRLQNEYPDGMASLPTTSAGSGYLGNSSGSSILSTITHLIPEYPGSQATQQEQNSFAHVGQIRSPSLSAHLSNTAVLNRLIDAYFMGYNPAYPIVHESTFREKYQNRQLIHPCSSWHLIFYLVLAIGDWILGGESEAEQSRYYTAARSHMSMRILESGSLLAVQAFLLMGNYLQKRDRPNTGYNLIGIAYRMALGLGLHREPLTDTTADTLFNERRRVIWWIVFCFDSGFSVTTGRPIMASDCFIETRLPRNIEDSACTLKSLLPAPTECPTTYSAIIAQVPLVYIGNSVYSELYSGANKTSFDLRISRSLDHQFKAWKLSLPVYFTAQDVPPWFRGPRGMLLWKEQNLRMMLWWGSQRLCSLPSDTEEAQNMCDYAAIETIQDITKFCLDHPDTLHVGLIWYIVYFLFQATIVLSAHHLRPSQPSIISLATANQELWYLSISRAYDCLDHLSQKCKAATRCIAVLDRIRNLSQPESMPTAQAEFHNDYPTDSDHLQAISENTNVHSTTFAFDPALQMIFEDSSWNRDIFEGLPGFLTTDEAESFDFLTTDTTQEWDLSQQLT